MKREFVMLGVAAGVSGIFMTANAQAAETAPVSDATKPATSTVAKQAVPVTALPKSYLGNWYAYLDNYSYKRHGKRINHYLIAKVQTTNRPNDRIELKMRMYSSRYKKLTHLKYQGQVSSVYDIQKYTNQRTHKVSYVLYPRLGSDFDLLSLKKVKVHGQKQVAMSFWSKEGGLMTSNGTSYAFRTIQRSHRWM